MVGVGLVEGNEGFEDGFGRNELFKVEEVEEFG